MPISRRQIPRHPATCGFRGSRAVCPAGWRGSQGQSPPVTPIATAVSGRSAIEIAGSKTGPCRSRSCLPLAPQPSHRVQGRCSASSRPSSGQVTRAFGQITRPLTRLHHRSIRCATRAVAAASRALLPTMCSTVACAASRPLAIRDFQLRSDHGGMASSLGCEAWLSELRLVLSVCGDAVRRFRFVGINASTSSSSPAYSSSPSIGCLIVQS